MDIFDFAASDGWAMLPERANQLAQIVQRQHEITPEVLEAYRAKSLQNADRARVRGNVAILDVSGPLFKKANLFTSVSGATSYDILRRDLQAAIDDPNVSNILMVIDSPGGQANGCDELATAIYDARSKKPVTAYVSGMACSGGYWIAAAASEIIISDAAILGSIGVVLGVQSSNNDPNAKTRTIEFVSSQSPGKRPDPNTEAGQARIQNMVDDLASVFIDAVAKYRGVSAEDVVQNFGAGGVKIGEKAVASGMADRVGQLEPTIQSLISNGGKGRFSSNGSTGGFLMSDKTNGPTAEEIAAQAKADANARIKAITTSATAKVLPTLASALAFDTDLSAEASEKLMVEAKADLEAAASKSSETKPTARDDYKSQKEQAGALGLGNAEVAGKTDAFDPFASAIKSHNARF